MNGAPDRAWRFTHPDFEAPAEFAGLTVGPAGRISMVAGTDAVRQSILLLLSTIPGERVMRPEYGCYLHRLVFSPNDNTTAGLAMHYVRQALERWEPRVEIVDLDAGPNPLDESRLDIVLTYRARATRHVEPIAFTLSLTGEEL